MFRDPGVLSVRRVAVAGCLLAAALAATLSALVTAEVVEVGRLLPWGGEGIRRMRVWGALEFYVSSETGPPPPDVVTTCLLLVVATVAAFAALLLARSGVRGRRSPSSRWPRSAPPS